MRILAVLVAIAMVLLAAVSGSASAGASKDVPPFAFTYQITGITLTSTLSVGGATATTALHLAVAPRQTTLSWFGKRPGAGGMHNGVGLATKSFRPDSRGATRSSTRTAVVTVRRIKYVPINCTHNTECG